MIEKEFDKWFEHKYGELKRVFDSTHMGFGKDCYKAGYSSGQKSKWVSVKERLPEDREWVEIYVPDRPWIAKDSGGKHFVKVVQTITAADVWGNNLVPYYWNEFGPGSFFGQEPTHWRPIEIPDQSVSKEGETK